MEGREAVPARARVSLQTSAFLTYVDRWSTCYRTGEKICPSHTVYIHTKDERNPNGLSETCQTHATLDEHTTNSIGTISQYQGKIDNIEG